MISIQNLTFAFKKGNPLFSGLSLQMNPGSIYGLFGLNGAGKTTLLNHISGMLFPKVGECLLNGQPARDRTPKLMSELFIVTEQFTLPAMTGNTYVAIHAPFYPRFDHSLFEKIITEFEVDISSSIPELSYGQRKKFLIAFALASNTAVLLMDEPTNGLDIPSKSQFRRIVASLDQSERCTVISTHQVRDLGSMIDQISVIKDGAIVFDHDLETIQKNLSFRKLKDPENQDYIYGEEILGGVHALCRAKPDSDHSFSDDIDLELLFNAIISKTDDVNREFKNLSQ
ncbi:MAG: ABC transporter ATP-binding protein [Balneolaceae bacterium]